MVELTNHFATILLAVMIVLTLVLLPLLNDDRPARDERQRTEELRLQIELGKLKDKP
ncbi:MAG: hypothetical protein HXY37_05920 [Chloroflexi bacterium]|nr:hypothetical protein [Chloroflexota bacterium]